MQEWERKECRKETEMNQSTAQGVQEEEQEGLGA